MNPGAADPVPPPFVPVVRYMTVSNDLRVDPLASHLVDVIGLLYSIRSLDDPPFPLLYRQLCVFLALTDSRGEGEGWLECVNADTGQRIFRSVRHRIVFGDDPLRVVGARFRVVDCPFPSAGMYAVQFWYNGTLVDQKYVRVG
jgi:hypothetical protein